MELPHKDAQFREPVLLWESDEEIRQIFCAQRELTLGMTLGMTKAHISP